MPRLHHLQDFDECPPPEGRFENMVPEFCFVSVHVQEPKNKSLYEYIQDVSSNSKQNYNHLELTRGICMQSCFEIHQKIPQYMDYIDDDLPVVGGEEKVPFGNIYNKLCNVCINKDLKDNYGLMAKSDIVYCVDKQNRGLFDFVDVAFMISFGVVLLMIPLSMLYERKQNSPKVLRIFSRLTRIKKWLKAFSIEQNWKKLIEDTSNDLGDVACLHGLKIVIFFLFIFTQVYRHIVSSPFANPITVEKVSD